jgi:pimeloyl-ACP methyl ester carboxylesterase
MTMKTFLLPGVLTGRWTYDAVLDAYGAHLIDFNNPDLYASPETVTIRHLAQFALDEITRVAPKDDLYLFGHSMGGYVIFELLRLMRETGFDMTRIKGIAFLGTSAEADAPEKKTQRLGQVADVNAGQFEKVADTMLRAVFGTSFMAANAAFVARARADILNPAKNYARIFVGQQYAIMSRPNYREEGDLGAMPDCPILFMWGDEDKIAPPEVREMTRKALPLGYYVILPDTGHFLTAEQPDAVLKTLTTLFLKG